MEHRIESCGSGKHSRVFRAAVFWDVTQRPPRCVTFQKTAARETKTNSTGDVSYSKG